MFFLSNNYQQNIYHLTDDFIIQRQKDEKLRVVLGIIVCIPLAVTMKNN